MEGFWRGEVRSGSHTFPRRGRKGQARLITKGSRTLLQLRWDRRGHGKGLFVCLFVCLSQPVCIWICMAGRGDGCMCFDCFVPLHMVKCSFYLLPRGLTA